MGVQDQRQVETRPDVLVYTSAPVERLPVFAGEISAFSPFSDPSRAVMIVALDCKRRRPDDGDAPCRATSNRKKLNSHTNSGASGTSARRDRAARCLPQCTSG